MAELQPRKLTPRLTLVVGDGAREDGGTQRKATPEPALVEIIRLLARQIGDELEAAQVTNEQGRAKCQ